MAKETAESSAIAVATVGLQAVATFSGMETLSYSARNGLLLAACAGVAVWSVRKRRVSRWQRWAAIVCLLVVAASTVTLQSLLFSRHHIVFMEGRKGETGFIHLRGGRTLARAELSFTSDRGPSHISRTASNDDEAPQAVRWYQRGANTVVIEQFRYPQELVIVFALPAGARRSIIQKTATPSEVEYASREDVRRKWYLNAAIGGSLWLALSLALFWSSSPPPPAPAPA